MIARPLALAVALVAVGVVSAACRTTGIQNVYDAPLAAPDTMSQAELLAAIQRGGAERGWVIEPVGPGEALGRLRVRGRHLAVVTIVYDRSRLSIYYKDSENLLYDGARIHRNYNRWVRNLESDIQDAVQEAALAGPS